MKTLYVTDLDGTLLNARSRISPYSLAVIHSLIKKGMLFTYATARSLSSSLVVTDGLSIDIPVIVYNGALIINPSTNEILSSVVFSKEEADEVMDALKKYDISPLVYSYIGGVEKVSWVKGRENEGMKHYLKLREGDRRLRALENSDSLFLGNMFYFTCIGEKEELLPLYDVFSKKEQYNCILQQELYRTEYWCEIMPKRATKAEAIVTLKELCGCERVISFGDAVNDIPMFQISDECYAVSNAVGALKDVATGVIGSNTEDGVAKWLQEHADTGFAFGESDERPVFI